MPQSIWGFTLMPCLWGTHNNSQVFLDVGIIDASTITLPPPGSGPILPPTQTSPPRFRALVDTGAQRTMISPNVVSTLGLTSVGLVSVLGAGHNVTQHNSYLFHVAFVIPIVPPGATIVPGTLVRTMIFVLANPIHGAEITSTSGLFDVLLGMDVISGGSLKIEGNGTYSFSI